MPANDAEHDEHRLTNGFIGYLETPHPDQVIADRSLVIRGWVFGPAHSPHRIWVRRKRTGVVEVASGLPRPDVERAYPDHPDAALSGFEGTVALSGVRPGPCTFEICAEDASGRTSVLFTRRVDLGHRAPPTMVEILRDALAKAIRAFRDGRLPISPLHWVAAFRSHVAAMRPPRTPPAQPTGGDGDAKDVLTRLCRTQLQGFLDTGARLTFPSPPQPQVSIILVLYNRAELTLRCLRSLLEPSLVDVEVILVDNASTDDTPAMLQQLDGVVVLRQDRNVGFLHGVNDGARLARGRHLLLLNNDTEVMPGALDAAVACLESDPTIGAVGARLILPDGTLQEAGSIIWRDGSCTGYGRGDSPHAPEYQFRRDVDFCSGAFLLTPRALFEELGGLDAAYEPAYYEEVDYCVRLLKRDFRIVYEPRAVISHFEFASSRSVDAVRMQVERRTLFEHKHSTWLHGQCEHADGGTVHARARTGNARRILCLDDRVPFDHLGAGYPRARLMLESLHRAGHAVTLYPMITLHDRWTDVYEALPAELEVMLGRGPDKLRDFLDERQDLYDCMIVSRPHNLRTLRSLYKPDEWPPMPLIYDAEALFTLRDVQSRRIAGETISEESVHRRIGEEVGLARGATLVACVSDAEAAYFRRAGHATSTIAHAVEPNPTGRSFEDRHGFLFVGALNEDGTPNSDSVVWFTREVLPRIHQRIGPVVLTVVGDRPPSQVAALASSSVSIVGRVDNVEPSFDAARVFVAPTRFAAGIPLKLLQAAALGLPAVCTTVLQRQLSWTAGEELLAADDPDEFAAACCRAYTDAALWQRLRSGALSRMSTDYSIDRFETALAGAVASIPARGSAR